MKKEWSLIEEALTHITISSNPNNEPVTIHGSSEDLRCIGVGTDAAVFQSLHTPDFAFKVYAEDKISKKEIEREVYLKLGNSPFFSTCYDSGETYLVLSFESGITLYDCLLQGVHIPEQVIKDVEEARAYVRKQGLNPRDIHLRNILLQEGRGKILDVSEYVLPGNDYRWEHLKKAYEDYYSLIDGKSMPFWLLETIRKWYNQMNRQSSSFDEFMKNVLKHTTFWKS